MKKTSSHIQQFKAIVDDYLERTFQRFPEQASGLGLEQFQSQLGRNSPADYKAQQALINTTLAAVEGIPNDALDPETWLDRRVFLSLLRTQIVFNENLKRWRTDPQIHANSAIHSIFDLLIRHSGKLSSIFPAVEARLKRIPDYLEAGAECVSQPVPLWVQLTEQTCEGAVEFFSGLESELNLVSPHPKKTQQLLRDASRAFQKYAATISRKKSGPASRIFYRPPPI